MIAAWIGAVCCGIWIYLLIGRGSFWRILLIPSELTPVSQPAPRVAVIIPARNEGDVIGRVVRGLLAQDYPGPLHIYVVNDHSTDDTASRVLRASMGREESVTMISAAPLPSGWTGKMWALSQGVSRAGEFNPEYFLFTDADIVHAPGSVRASVALAQSGSRDLVSTMVKLECESFAERALIPAFVFFFFMLYPPKWVNSRRQKTAAAAGGDILVRADALARAGGIETIRNELIDDCALAREIKSGGSVWIGLTNDARSIRSYAGFGEIGRMISRNAFYQLRHSAWLLLGTILGLAITYLLPIALLFFGGWATVLGATAWMLMSLSYWPMVRFYSLSPIWAFTLPLIAIFYMGATIHSAIQYWLGHGGEWKGRVQDVGKNAASSPPAGA